MNPFPLPKRLEKMACGSNEVTNQPWSIMWPASWM
jgi:hypothetical protein